MQTHGRSAVVILLLSLQLLGAISSRDVYGARVEVNITGLINRAMSCLFFVYRLCHRRRYFGNWNFVCHWFTFSGPKCSRFKVHNCVFGTAVVKCFVSSSVVVVFQLCINLTGVLVSPELQRMTAAQASRGQEVHQSRPSSLVSFCAADLMSWKFMRGS